MQVFMRKPVSFLKVGMYRTIRPYVPEVNILHINSQSKEASYAIVYT
jgi:hypothetical protein